MSTAESVSRRSPYRNGEARRKEILTEAKRAFADSGYHGASLREIARVLGVSPGVIVHHFSTKEQLLVAVLAERDVESSLSIAARGEVGIADAVLDLMSDNLREPGLIALFAKLTAEGANPEHPAHDYFERRYEDLTDQIAAGVRAEHVGGEASVIDARSAARLILALMDGLQLQWLYNRQTPVLPQLAQALAALGFTTRTPG